MAKKEKKVREKKPQQKKSSTIKKDRLLVERIQPRGGITFKDEKVIEVGNGYETCIHVYKLPTQVETHWMIKLCNIDDAVTVVDVHTEDGYEVKKNLNKSIQEQSSRYRDAQSKEEEIDAEEKYTELEKLLREVSTYGEVIKTIHVRIFVYDKSLEGLEAKVKDILNKLESESYIAAVLLNESKDEWLSMWRMFEEQKTRFSLNGLPITSEALAGGDPFHFSSLDDQYGDYLGYTACGGNVVFDEFTKTEDRLYYNAVIVGEMGSGKSTLLKKRFLARAIRGDYVRTFDVSGEFTNLTESLGGKVIRPDGTGGILNPLEILAAGDNDRVNFARHISKVTTIYRFLVPSAKIEEITEFQNTLRELYERYNLDPARNTDRRGITERTAKEYPTFSNLLNFIRNKIKHISSGKYNEMEQKRMEKRMLTLDNIEGVINNIVNTYGAILDGHTSMDNIIEEQIVTFDISQLKEMDSNVFNAQIFNMVSLCWDNCVKNGSAMKSFYEQGKIRWEDITRFLILIDESHRWINTSKMQAVELITLYMREARKYFGGIFLASQSIRDYVPESGNSENLDKLKNIFELTQYKFIFRQSSNIINLLSDIFGGILTPTQLAQIPRLSVGKNVLNINSETSLLFKVDLSLKEERLFSGGA